jgi:rhomboid family GlyGly-CTERM serine protease
MISNASGQTVPGRGFSRLLRSLNGDGRYGVTLLACLLLCASASLGGAGTLAVLRYERSGLHAGEYWRLLSAHFVHLDAYHLALNLSGLALLWSLFARDYRPSQWLLIILLSIAAVDAGLWFLSPEVLWYVGLSGLLHGLWAAGACASGARREPYGALLIVALLAKLAYEHFIGPNPLDQGMPVVTIAHIYGAAGGALAALVLALQRRRI